MTDGVLQRRLRAGEFAVTSEITPALSADPQTLLEKALPMRGLADAVNITDGASARAHLDPLTAAGILVANGVEPVLQLTCRDRNRIALQSMLVGAAALGVRNLLALKGDDPKAGDQPDARPVFDLDSNALIVTARTIRDQGRLPHGRVVGGSAAFFIGAADAPIDPAPGWRPDSLLAKAQAGAQFIQTQFCMDIGVVRRYLARLCEFGVPQRLHILIGLAPLASARSARWIRRHLFGSIIPDALIARLESASDERLEGQRICLELMQQLRQVPGVAGVHLMAPLNETSLPAVIQQFRDGAARG
ncbi:MAG TPA: methylenetetrahydrofolate reductase [Steroidobacteraceae bacterium]|jgi:methylenetetrahydrofolate reductase (NADPH)|nr:methylenetetrahydrofolate reductase [Steroidobacteraceae bacterium]